METTELNGDVALFARTTPCYKCSNFDGQRDDDKGRGALKFHQQDWEVKYGVQVCT
jgi:hypothetical protein